MKDSRDIDFDDVFGGPPRQSLMRGKRVAEADRAKPIFGGKSVVRRRHVHGDHFFDDIFRGHESYSSTWRTDLYSSRFSNKTNGGRHEIKYEVHQSNRYHSIADSGFSPAHFKEDFANIFNKESYSSLKTHVKMQTQSCRWTSDQKVIGSLRKVERERCLQTKTTNKETSFSSGFMRSESKILMENSDDSFEDFFELQELSNDLEKDTPCTKASEETKAADAKIRQWSVGKTRNLRSLLSTLQYVLWRGSEWQPIALVDLVEENQVKRAYQKALLRLHPDKLQQRNTASHHKYIAEKVFEIIQEAWDHFNNIAPL